MSIHELEIKPLPELIRLAHDDEPNAFTVLTKIINIRLTNDVHLYARCYRDAQEIKDDALLKVNRAVHGNLAIDIDKFFVWLKAIAKNAAIDYYRHKYRFYGYVNPVEWEKDNSPDELEMLCSKEVHAILMKAIDKLPDQQRTVTLLIIQEQLTYEEISERLNISVGTVSATYRDAKKNLKDILTGRNCGKKRNGKNIS